MTLEAARIQFGTWAVSMSDGTVAKETDFLIGNGHRSAWAQLVERFKEKGVFVREVVYVDLKGMIHKHPVQRPAGPSDDFLGFVFKMNSQWDVVAGAQATTTKIIGAVTKEKTFELWMKDGGPDQMFEMVPDKLDLDYRL